MEYKKLNEQISDPVNDNVKALANLFPSAVKDGEVDFEALKEELGKFSKVGKEKYELTWAGKQASKKKAQEPVLGRTLKYVPEDSKDADTTQNLYIEGDNLEVLKLLRENYYGSIKMIYIDPPYNTGNDFIYNDDFKMTQEESDKAEGDIDKEGNRLIKNQKSNNRFHARWLNMMYPRLRLAKDLLTQDGVIFISIDDNEAADLRQICNQIFGEDCFVTCICLEITKTQGMKVKSAKEGSIVKNYECILCYTKRLQNKKIVKNILYDSNYDYDTHFSYYISKKSNKYFICKLTDILLKKENVYDEFEKLGLIKNNSISINNIGEAIKKSNKIKNYIYHEISQNVYQEMACDININNDIENLLKKEKIVEFKNHLLTKSSGNKLRQYSSLKETLNYSDDYKREFGKVTIRGNLWKGFYSDMMNVSKEGNIKFDNGKKPVRLIKQLIKWIGISDNDIVLDFFSGSSTTAHAVMQLNAEDGGYRKFIMVQFPEPCDEKSEAYKAKFKNICEIGKERIRRAGDKIKKELKEKQSGQESMLKDENNVDPDSLDIGFKVFRTGDTNIRWTHEALKNGQIDIDQDAMSGKDKLDFMPGFKDIDVVYEVLLRQRDVPLSSKIEKLNDIGDRTYMFAESFVVCLEEKVDKEMIEKLAAIEPLPIKYVFRDSAFEDDIELKDETFRRLNALIERNTGESGKAYTVEFI